MFVKGFQDTIDWYDNNAKQYAEASAAFPTKGNMEKFVKLLPKNAKVLDAGCGAGRDTNLLARYGLKTVGLDISRGLLKEARERFPYEKFVQGDLRSLPFENEVFDGIWSQASLLHLETIEDVNKSLLEFTRVLKKGGILYVYVKKQLGNEKTAIVADSISRHDRFFQYFTQKEIEKLIKNMNYVIITVEEQNDQSGRSEVKWIMVLGRKS